MSFMMRLESKPRLILYRTMMKLRRTIINTSTAVSINTLDTRALLKIRDVFLLRSAEIVELIGKADKECVQHFGVLPRQTTERLWHETVRSVELQFNSGSVYEARSVLLKPMPSLKPELCAES